VTTATTIATTTATSTATAAAITTTTAKVEGWSQLGDDIDGEAVEDFPGVLALSQDAKTVAVGAPDGASGQVRIYVRLGAAWAQRGDAIDGEVAGDAFGNVVSLSSNGETVAIGAYSSGDDYGQVRVYTWSGSMHAWVQRGGNIDGKKKTGYEFGYALELSKDGNTVAVGAYQRGQYGDGRTKVFVWTGNAWEQRGQALGGVHVMENAGHPISLSADGKTMAIADVHKKRKYSRIRVFMWSAIENKWLLDGREISGQVVKDAASSVSLSSNGNTLAAGARGAGGRGNVGQVRVYYRTFAGWYVRGDAISPKNPDEKFGGSVSLAADGKTVAVGAFQNGAQSGHVRVFTWIGSYKKGGWVQRGIDINGEAWGDINGPSISLSGDGEVVAIKDESGHALVYSHCCA
jgi:hypothetical protein